ncbi:hypothetical protein ZIOFF_003287 [Zingiber officinale]|uniref:chitinase n=1 Tax=Zingiber officinale TaxID=94328 RepID=A0A8J5I697_ZINOF|nr:hypothetical protein ZIOFF_003287 [Zingiber officinale]
MTTSRFLAIVCTVAVLLLGASGKQCGVQNNGALCPNGLCCSEYGWCGNTAEYCCNDCQSQCHCNSRQPPTLSSSSPVGGVADIISASLFEEMLNNRNNDACPAKAAANSFNGFGTTGDMDTRKQELAAFLGRLLKRQVAGRLPGYGVITNIINGGVECGRGFNQAVFNRIQYYKRYCDMLGVGYGDNLDCYNQRPFGTCQSDDGCFPCTRVCQLLSEHLPLEVVSIVPEAFVVLQMDSCFVAAAVGTVSFFASHHQYPSGPARPGRAGNSSRVAKPDGNGSSVGATTDDDSGLAPIKMIAEYKIHQWSKVETTSMITETDQWPRLGWLDNHDTDCGNE